MSSGDNEKRGGTTVQRTDVPEFIKPYVTDVLKQAQEQAGTPREQFEGSTVVPFAPETEAALQAITQRAQQGSPLLQAAQQQQQQTLAGAYLDPTQSAAYKGLTESVVSDVLPETYRSYASGGQYWGSPAEAEAVGRGGSPGVGPYVFQQAGQERQLQEAAAGRAPGLAQADYQDMQALLGVGGARESLEAEKVNEAYRRFLEQREEPRQRLADYAALVYGGVPGQYDIESTQVARGGNPLLTGLGYAAQTAPVFASLFGGT